MDPAKSGNALRFINDCIGMPKGQTKSVAPVEVFDFATLRPHIFFFTVAPVKANQELLMDYGEVSFPPITISQRCCMLFFKKPLAAH